MAASVAVATFGPPAAIAAGGSTSKAAGRAQAVAELLRRADLGHGWSATAAPKSVPPLTCSAFNPSLRGDVEVGAALSPRFEEQTTAEGPISDVFVSQAVYVYATPAQGAAAARALLRPKLGRCFAASLVAGSGGGVHFTALKAQALHLPRLPVAAVGFRVPGTASQSTSGAYQVANVFLDAIVLAHGQTVTEVSFASFAAPPASSLEVRLARRIAQLVTSA